MTGPRLCHRRRRAGAGRGAVTSIREVYYVNIASQILLYAIFALGLNVLVGYAGLVSLGHAGLFGVAAYVVAYLLAAGYGHAFAILAALGRRACRDRGLRRTGAAGDRHQLHHDHARARRNHLGRWPIAGSA